ncbi:MAG: hypothetical protein R2745_17035 [Vicinamibacterales bacterium]
MAVGYHSIAMESAATVRAAGLLTAAVISAAAVASAQRDASGRWLGVLDEHPAIEYAMRPTTDVVGALNARLASGERTLAFDAADGYLRPLLAALDVPVASQMLVLSRTGVQREVTRPANPRALYFNEQVAVGYIRGAPFLELIAHDPVQGAVFYTLDQRATDRPSLTRQTSCLSCHVASATMEVPGFLTRSLTAAPDGMPTLKFFSQALVDHRTPFADRWGGFYVTGHGGITHRGNVVVDRDGTTRSLVPAGPRNVATLEGVLPLDGYPSPLSDVTALAVFDHQTRALNLMTRLGWEARVARHEGRVPLESPVVTALVDDLAAYLLFADEAPMPGGLSGTSGFREWFSGRGAHDAAGRSLHQLDLETRLMTYPLSYTIESPAFDALPDDVRQAVADRLVARLSAAAPRPGDDRFTADQRRAALAIFRAAYPALAGPPRR